MAKEKVRALRAEELYHCCDLEKFDFQTTDELEPLTEVLGQPRAVAAVQLGMKIRQDGYNIFAMGPPGVGKQYLTKHFLSRQAESMPTPPDWCYVYNFKDARQPVALRLPAGQGVKLRQDMEQLIEALKSSIPAAFEGQEFQMRRQMLEDEMDEQREAEFEDVRDKAKAENFALVRTPVGFVFAPLDGEDVLTPEEFDKLSEERQEELKQRGEVLMQELQKVLHKIPQWEREKREKLKELQHEMVAFVVDPLFEELETNYHDFPEIIEYFKAAKQDITEHVDVFLGTGQSNPLMGELGLKENTLKRYQVNAFIDNSEQKGAPLIYEGNPSYPNLFGRIERVAQMGALITDFTLMTPGALHKANGGYLLVDVRKLLVKMQAWEGLKRTLREKQICLESLDRSLGLTSTASLEPAPIPLEVKVVLFGDPMLYQLLSHFDPEFPKLFKIVADFDHQMESTPETLPLYARMLGTLAKTESLRALEREAVGRVIEHSAREAGDVEKLTTHMETLLDLLREADYWAEQNDSKYIRSTDVQQAIDAGIYRLDRWRERIQEGILRDTIFIDTSGSVVGQINALSVTQMGKFSFGRPHRITARIRMGRGKVIDIEREVELGGALHSKGILILSSFLAARYAADQPLPLSASLVFEQSYSGIEGDSASSAELYALMSAIADVPIKQSFAVTGSVNQNGQIQPIGGVNEKVEGFFAICKARGLTGEQGVLIPAANVKHLMLEKDVVAAVKEGRFHIYPIKTVDEGLHLLTGMPMGTRDKDTDEYPEGTINHRIQSRLNALADKWLALQKNTNKDKEGSLI